MISYRNLFPAFSCAVFALGCVTSEAQPGPPGFIIVAGGNGQVVGANFPTRTPMTIQIFDTSGRFPVGGVPVSWTITCGPSDYACEPQSAGTLQQAGVQTDSNGFASTNYIQSFIMPGLSYTQATVTATTSAGSVDFHVTTIGALSNNLPAISALIVKPGSNGTITGPAGGTLPGAVQVAVGSISGFTAGQQIPNVGVQIIDALNPSGPPPAWCIAPASTVLTDASGNATCDLMLGNTPGTYRVATDVGGQAAPEFFVTITQAQSCTFSISPQAQALPSTGGTGTITVITQAGCAWSATSNAPGFITTTFGASGNGNGVMGYSVAANNTGVARSGTISVAGKTFSIVQSAAGPVSGSLTITSGSILPGAVQGASYSTTLTASGGSGVYSWSVTSGSLPPGLTLSLSGIISGIPLTVGTYPFTITVNDNVGAFQSQVLAIVVGAPGAGLTILTTGVANGTAGMPYSQPLQYAQTVPCGSPFSPLPGFSVIAGSLPPGLSIQYLSSGYAIAGTPTTPGSYPFSLVLTNSCSQSLPVSLTIAISGSGTIIGRPARAGVFRQGFLWIEDVDGDHQTIVPPDHVFGLGGIPGDIPITGDWNGSGTTKAGIFRPNYNGQWVLDWDGTGQNIRVYYFGGSGDLPVVGDWSGDGKSKIGLFRAGFLWVLDQNGDGVFDAGDAVFPFGGVPGDVPLVGDWNGNGISKPGLFRQGFLFILDSNGNHQIDAGDPVFGFGGYPGDVPLVGDWTGTGISQVGLFRQGFLWILDMNGNHQIDAADSIFGFGGSPGDIPVVGKW